MKKLLTILLLAWVVGAAAQTTTQYAYDNLGRLTKVTYANGAIVNYTYDANGNRITETITGGTAVIEIKDGSAISLYPNPAKDRLYVKTETEKSIIKIYAIDGSLIKTLPEYQSNQEINVSALNAGVYLIKITASDGKTYAGKFVKE